jgi:hypothetical protein
MRITPFLGPGIELPETAVTDGFGVLAKRGKGKTNLAGVMEEIFLRRGHSIVVLDPPDAHWGIRYEADDDGKPTGPSGFDVLIIGGEHGDIPIEQTSGREAARIIVDGNISCVIEMKALGFTERQRWCADFADEIFRINRTPRHIFFEEAQNFLPQQLKFDEQKAVLYAMSRIIEEGRSSGLGFTIISQRPAKVNKDALTQIDNMIVLGMMGPQDIDQVEEWFKHHFHDKDALRAMIETLPKLKPGEAWALMPEHLKEPVKFTVKLRATYHAGRTPKPGESVVNVAKFTVSEAVKKLKESFAEKQQERRAEIQNLNEAKKRIRELETQLRAKPKTVPAKPQLDYQAMKAATQIYERTIREYRAAIGQFREQLAHIQERAKRGLAIEYPDLDFRGRESHAETARPARGHASPAPNQAASQGSIPTARESMGPNRLARPVLEPPNGDLQGPHKKILRALGELLSIGREQAPKPMVAAWAGYSPGGGAFMNPLGYLRTAGLVHYPQPGSVALTDAGREHVGPCEPPDQDEIHRRVRDVLPGPARKILSVLLELPPGTELSKEQLAEQAGYTEGGGAFQNPLGALRTAGFVNYPRSGYVRASDWLFLE